MRGRIEQYCNVKQEVILVLKESPRFSAGSPAFSTTGPMLSPVSALCLTCEPSQCGKVADL